MDAARALAEEQAALRQLVSDLRTELEGIMAAQDANPPDDEHDVEGSSVGYERARVTALLARAEGQLHEADAAAARQAAGAYGRCDGCGGPIGDDRLVALPMTRRCVTCAATSRYGLLPR
ncbi:MAG: TraR/DksA C4-type zinc finger protein [Acidimicrobiales bacterium]